MIAFLRKCLCRHRWVKTGDALAGATLDWNARPTVCWTIHERCEKCQETRSTSGWLFPLREWKYYAPDGWPITESGERMHIYGGGRG